MAFSMVLFVKERPAAATAKSRIDISARQFPKSYWIYLLVTAVFALGSSSNQFLILRTQDMGASLELTILVYAAFNLVAALISYPAGSLSDRWGRRNVLLAAFGIFLIAYLGFATMRNIVLIRGLFIFYGLYQGMFRSVGKAFAADLVPEHLRATGVGWYNTTLGMLQLVASLVAGLLWDRVSHAAVFYNDAMFAVLGSIALMGVALAAMQDGRYATPRSPPGCAGARTVRNDPVDLLQFGEKIPMTVVAAALTLAWPLTSRAQQNDAQPQSPAAATPAAPAPRPPSRRSRRWPRFTVR